MVRPSRLNRGMPSSFSSCEIFGGDGYFEDCPYGPTERLYRDCRAMWLEEGAPCVQRITIARECQNHGGKIEYTFD